MNLDRLGVHTYSVHHGVKELKEIRKQLAKVAQGWIGRVAANERARGANLAWGVH